MANAGETAAVVLCVVAVGLSVGYSRLTVGMVRSRTL